MTKETSTAEVKAELRREYQRLRSEFARHHGEAASAAITQSVLRLPAYRRARTVMVYVSFRSEVRTHTLMDDVLQTGRHLILPKTVRTEPRMILCRVTDPQTQLATGNMGIMEPVLDRVEVIGVEDLDLVLVPGLVFDCDGFRIGYGGGYFDRLLSEANRERTFFCGIAYDMQLRERVPYAAHDQRVDALITERRTLFFDV